MARGLCTFSLVFFVLVSAQSHARRHGIVDTKAPEVWASQWINLASGEARFSVTQNRGKVIYLLFFQSWCPGCHSRGFPTLKEVSKTFSKNRDVVFATIQTVFEGATVNTPAKAWSTVRTFGLTMPTGHDPGPTGRRSTTMARYRSGGTPWVVIIDRSGVVKFNGFHITAARATRLVASLLEAPALSLP
jgi:thiol-disulfide isomerase/thioredoxin